jgi:hypothetical protein
MRSSPSLRSRPSSSASEHDPRGRQAMLKKPKAPLPSPAPKICKPLENRHFYRPQRSIRAFATQICYTTVIDDSGLRLRTVGLKVGLLQLRKINILTAFGLVAVSAMLVCYAMEDRSRWWVLGFAGSCVAGSAYGFLQGAWPFGLVEAIWSIVALRRWVALSSN